MSICPAQLCLTSKLSGVLLLIFNPAITLYIVIRLSCLIQYCLLCCEMFKLVNRMLFLGFLLQPIRIKGRPNSTEGLSFFPFRH